MPCPWRVPLNRTNTQCNLSASEPRLARAFLARVNNDGTCAYHPRRIIIGIYLHTVRATLLLLLRFIVCANRRVYTRVCTHAGRCTAPYGPPPYGPSVYSRSVLCAASSCAAPHAIRINDFVTVFASASSSITTTTTKRIHLTHTPASLAYERGFCCVYSCTLHRLDHQQSAQPHTHTHLAAGQRQRTTPHMEPYI